MVEIFHYTELKSDKVFSQRKEKTEVYDFKELEEIRFKKGKEGNFSLAYGQEKIIEGKKFLEAAKKQSKLMIEEAKNRASEIEKAAYEKGNQKVLEDGKKKLEPILAMFQENLEKLFKYQKEMYTKSEDEILNLAISLASRIIHHEVRTNKDIIMKAIKTAANRVMSREQITIRINPEDMEYVLQNKSKLKDDLDNIQQVSFKEDSSVSKGGCIIDTNFGSISAIIEKEFDEFEKLLKNEFAVSKKIKEQGE